ncbi:hypothetical protein M422DRAFT_107600, partial [Sphaerobolus stellatus SS14]
LRAMATGNLTRPDNIFATSRVADTLKRCRTIPEEQPTHTNHFPIKLVFDTTLQTKENFKDVDWTEFNEHLSTGLSILNLNEMIRNVEEFEERRTLLEKALQATIEAIIPMTRPSKYMKCWWTKELSKLRAETRRLMRQLSARRQETNHPIHDKYRRAQNTY